ncbi:hypothetical protein AB0D08_08510 [Kitasatospora sp. NPDC048540]|uniref:hypothetical protein n=1 Tax=Kitasatospora sp. NPDC048540 TaxID=3155634 RepID=UPI0033E48443
MIDIVVVLRAEDAVLDFLSVLADPGGAQTEVVVAGSGTVLTLPAGAPPAERLALLGPLVGPAGPADAPSGPGPDAAALIARAGAGRPARIWTHSPADNRRSRGTLGRSVARAAAGAALPVRHAVGYSPYLQFVSDLDHPLSRELVSAKLEFVNRWCAHLLACDHPQHMLRTARVPSAERFFEADEEERDRLFALLASLDDEAASVADPWEFDSSRYEADRLDAAAAWIARHCPPQSGQLVEVGACEGALTRRLAAAGHQVLATEPNPRFRTRLAAALAGTPAVRIGDADLAALTGPDAPASPAHLLIEMLYYGQDLDLIDRLPTERVLVALEPATLDARLRPWLAGSRNWRAAEETELVGPRLEPVCGGRAYLSKRGSTGVLLRRTRG